MSEHNDPLEPAYRQGASNIQEEDAPRSRVGSRTNLMVMLVVVLLCLGLIYFLGREKPVEPAPPPATEVR